MASVSTLRRFTAFSIMGIATALSVPASAAQPDSPAPQATPAQPINATNFVGLTQSLEASPQQPGAQELRVSMLRWLAETPDYMVTLCQVMNLPDQDEAAKNIGLDLLMQQSFGNLAFQIDQRESSDQLSRQVAGVESALRAYAAFIAADPALRIAAMDTLAAQQKAGTLRAHLAPVVKAECGASDNTVMLNPETAGQAAPSPFLGGFLRATSVVYPLQVGQWKALGERRYDDVAGGASVRFQQAGNEDGWIDVYFYPVGVLDQEQRAGLLEGERKGLLEARSAALAGRDDMSRVQTVTLKVAPVQPDAANSIEASVLDFGFVRDGKEYSSVMLLAIDRLYAIKLRYSVPTATASRNAARGEVETFAAALLPQLDISNSGGCGSVPVTARDRLRLGCTGTDPVLPVVGEGQREMRFEYAPPR
ncbi:hypothetical protein [Stenotrophomonas sp. YAU14D1_LEIMI4_1]|uniref:hypothetical protein n=1 Tax=Stenotrophomonas sp. YAU14D1_LEIMI4_1 TaxID=2072407 RepID=UPI00131F4505|nr:hypothetical protein [Stenotrophomonas sp. YAU14D1_LEIMI4_1]